MLGKRILNIIARTPTTRRGRLASVVGCALLTATVFPALYLDYGIAIYLSIFLPFAILMIAAVHWVDQRAQTH